MNKRQIKKQARNLLTGRPVRGICFHANISTSEDGKISIAEYFPANIKFRRVVSEYLGDVSAFELPFFIEMKKQKFH